MSRLFNELNKPAFQLSAIILNMKLTSEFFFQIFIREILSIEKTRIGRDNSGNYSHVCQEPSVVSSFFSPLNFK